jgi:carboxypeptidase family protein
MIPAASRHAGVFARLLTLAFAVATARTASSQSSSAPTGAPHTAPRTAPSPFGVITGIVVDSLYGRRLVGAQISVEGLNNLAMTDSAGRFTIDSVPPGKYRIGVFHPLLDSLILSIASPPLQVFADSTLGLILATPSAPTFIRLVCGPIQIDTMAGIGPSVVVGRVLNAETEAPVAGVRVTLSWTDIQAGTNIGVHRIQRIRDTTTGPGGGFRFCNLPPSVNGVARAIIATADSGAVSRPLSLNGRLVVALVLHVPAAAKPATNSTHGTASSDGRATPP